MIINISLSFYEIHCLKTKIHYFFDKKYFENNEILFEKEKITLGNKNSGELEKNEEILYIKKIFDLIEYMKGYFILFNTDEISKTLEINDKWTEGMLGEIMKKYKFGNKGEDIFMEDFNYEYIFKDKLLFIKFENEMAFLEKIETVQKNILNKVSELYKFGAISKKFIELNTKNFDNFIDRYMLKEYENFYYPTWINTNIAQDRIEFLFCRFYDEHYKISKIIDEEVLKLNNIKYSEIGDNYIILNGEKIKNIIKLLI